MGRNYLFNDIEGFRAVAFDFDGTLVDTMELHYQAYCRVFTSLGLELPRNVFWENIGGKATETIPRFLQGRECSVSVAEIHARKKAEIACLFDAVEIPLLPASHLLPLFRKKLPLALVSSGSRAGIMQLLRRLNWLNVFDVIVTGEDTARSKPDPLPYLVAAQRLATPACKMLAFEDTDAGYRSAKSAGMAVFSVAGNAAFYIADDDKS